MLPLGDVTARVKSTAIIADDYRRLADNTTKQLNPQLYKAWRQAVINCQNAARMLIIKEKHGDRLFLIPTDAHLYEIALALVTSRQKQGYWYLDNLSEGDRGNQLDLFTGKAKLSAKQQAQDIIDAGDGRAAWLFLDSRSELAYEQYDIINFETELPR